MLAVRGNSDLRNGFEELGHLTGLQIDGIKRAAVLELRSKSVEQK